MHRRHRSTLACFAALVLLAGCAGGAGPTPSPTASPTLTTSAAPTASVAPTPTAAESATPSASASPATEPSDPSADWSELAAMLSALGLDPTNLGYTDDPLADGISYLGESREIGADLDIVRTFVGWATLDGAAYAAGGLFDCADGAVACGSDTAFDGQEVLLASVQMAAPVSAPAGQADEITLAVDRLTFDNAPADFGEGGYAGADLVAIYHAGVHGAFALQYDGQDFISLELDGRARVQGDSVLFVLLVPTDEQPAIKFVTQDERWLCQPWPAAELPAGGPICDEPAWEAGQFDFAPQGEYREIDNALVPAS